MTLFCQIIHGMGDCLNIHVPKPLPHPMVSVSIQTAILFLDLLLPCHPLGVSQLGGRPSFVHVLACNLPAVPLSYDPVEHGEQCSTPESQPPIDCPSQKTAGQKVERRPSSSKCATGGGFADRTKSTPTFQWASTGAADSGTAPRIGMPALFKVDACV